jgi:hypothetical protein
VQYENVARKQEFQEDTMTAKKRTTAKHGTAKIKPPGQSTTSQAANKETELVRKLAEYENQELALVIVPPPAGQIDIIRNSNTTALS